MAKERLFAILESNGQHGMPQSTRTNNFVISPIEIYTATEECIRLWDEKKLLENAPTIVAYEAATEDSSNPILDPSFQFYSPGSIFSSVCIPQAPLTALAACILIKIYDVN